MGPRFQGSVPQRQFLQLLTGFCGLRADVQEETAGLGVFLLRTCIAHLPKAPGKKLLAKPPGATPAKPKQANPS